ncbi:MAG: bifunctional DNA-binding transcriptional regulator/O6-methylguanine-DNA methyltransferase Ada [Bryobacteraceae bacterium]
MQKLEMSQAPRSIALAWQEEYWELVSKRDRNADGSFYYSVKTTGVYCRPSCSARLAKRENVGFFRTCADAEQAGFRPCARCKPNGASVAEERGAKVARVCELIQASHEIPSLEQLAASVEMSPFHLHRVFRTAMGLTPKQYALAQRSQRIRSRLQSGDETITEAIYGSGYNSNGRFYHQVQTILGMTPSKFRNGGEQEKINFAIGQCSLGAILVAQSERGICAVFLGDDPETLSRDLQDQFPRAELVGDDPNFEATIAKVVGFVDSPSGPFDIPVDVRGTAFQQRVWTALSKIPVGARLSYAELASIIGSPGSARAVARACAANKLAVAIPCHRIVRQNGEPGGYRWGLERKQQLLRRETQ